MVVLGTIEWQDQNFDWDWKRAFFSETKFSETQVFFPRPDFTKPRLFSKTKTETLKKIGKIAETEKETKER